MEHTQQPPGSEPTATTPATKETFEENESNAITSSTGTKRKENEDTGGPLHKSMRMNETIVSDENATAQEVPVETRTNALPLESFFTWDAILNFLDNIHKILQAAVFHFIDRSPLTTGMKWTKFLSPRAVDLTTFCDLILKQRPPELKAHIFTSGGSQYAWTVMKRSLYDVAPHIVSLNSQRPMSFLLDLAEGCRAVAEVIGSRARSDIEKLISIAKQRHASMEAEMSAVREIYQDVLDRLAPILKPDGSDKIASERYAAVCDCLSKSRERWESIVRERHSGMLDDDILDYMGPDSNGDKHKREGKRDVLSDLREAW